LYFKYPTKDNIVYSQYHFQVGKESRSEWWYGFFIGIGLDFIMNSFIQYFLVIACIFLSLRFLYYKFLKANDKSCDSDLVIFYWLLARVMKPIKKSKERKFLLMI